MRKLLLLAGLIVLTASLAQAQLKQRITWQARLVSTAPVKVGDVVTVRAPRVALGDLAIVESPTGERSVARAVELEGDRVTLQVFAGAKGLSTHSEVRFLGRSMRVPCSTSTGNAGRRAGRRQHALQTAPAQQARWS